ncbi:Holliday junction resolvase RuvX [Acholeplasma laidlawii]|uniref:Putative pre-16S rRNA nuclease n=2 Tax=Acholeplasma laidlawii TaxID=2148 RepID=A9NGN8_ACHLI|nr:Holliday junction resolvase RuvX [Acholeplasma laidlawii]ABX81518.1 predicted holliday junction resolvase [Acholeplasma laidlawii PG-8A]OAN20306.1 crossover junction endodeoxyribonuclease RuvA [Acholeplasma laidlawii]OED27880.1 Holliday junction DNA helicase RuvA [Acholeplasma laidlawii]OED28136.1 Holliday junction DNA helicase RuvA [Acholeplasma laidlawii]OED59474.1 Holliday junction DNA helicase RuvA [Acholeplasma laidlawii]
MKYFGLDLGEKSLGVAISESGIIASNLTTIRFKSEDYEDAVEQLLKLLNQYKIDCVVLGLPKHMNNDIGLKGQMAIDFKTLLASKSNVQVILWDERLSTKTALRILSDSNKKYDKQRNLKDEVAAQVILQNYLNSRGNTL